MDIREKSERNHLIWFLRMYNPKRYTLGRLGRTFDISNERVRQIAHKVIRIRKQSCESDHSKCYIAGWGDFIQFVNDTNMEVMKNVFKKIQNNEDVYLRKKPFVFGSTVLYKELYRECGIIVEGDGEKL